MRIWARQIAVLGTLALALLLGLYVRASSATGPRLRVLSAAAAACVNGDPAPALGHGQPLALALDGFAPSTPLALALTLPDGRVVGPGDLAPSGEGIEGGTFLAAADSNGAARIDLPTALSWPPGCYLISALADGSVADARFALLHPPTGPAPVGRATLDVVGQTSIRQGATVILKGADFRAEELLTLLITRPDGSLVVGSQVASDSSGRVTISYTLDEGDGSGRYRFVIAGDDGARAATLIRVRPLPSGAQGGAAMRVIAPFPARPVQGQQFQLAGVSFAPGESIRLLAVLPNGGRVSLGTTIADGAGSFSAEATLGPQRPTGVYRLLAEGATSGARAVARLTLRPAPLAALLIAPTPALTVPPALLPPPIEPPPVGLPPVEPPAWTEPEATPAPTMPPAPTEVALPTPQF